VGWLWVVVGGWRPNGVALQANRPQQFNRTSELVRTLFGALKPISSHHLPGRRRLGLAFCELVEASESLITSQLQASRNEKFTVLLESHRNQQKPDNLVLRCTRGPSLHNEPLAIDAKKTCTSCPCGTIGTIDRWRRDGWDAVIFLAKI
jgi:hypothetical protein